MKHPEHDEIIKKLKLIKEGKEKYPVRNKKIVELLIELIIKKKNYGKNLQRFNNGK